MQPETHSLLARNVDVRVPSRTLVAALDFDSAPGDFIAVLGRNGVGKTLTLHTLAGLRPSPGEVMLSGENIAAQPRREVARKLALLPQIVEDIFPSSVFDTAIVGRHPHIGTFSMPSVEDRSVVEKALRCVGLGGLGHRDTASLSGGERRRLAVAQVIVQNPRVFVLDEPLNHLDPQHQLDVMELFAQRARDGATVIAALHDVNIALRYATRCLLLHGDGRWVLGDTADVLTAAQLAELYGVGIDTLNWRGAPVFMMTGSSSSHRPASGDETPQPGQ